MLKTLCVFLLLGLLQARAQPHDLQPVHLKLSLTSTGELVQENEVIRFNLSIKCIAGENPRSIILPNSKDSGLKMIYLSFYTVDENNHYTRVYSEERSFKMSHSDVSPVWFHNLAKGDSVELPIFFRDTANYQRQVEAHHQWPQLPTGRYKVLAHYNPWDEEQAEMVYNRISQIQETQLLPSRFNMPESGLTSNYIDLFVKENGNLVFGSAKAPESCRADCQLCAAIEKGKWKKVKKWINTGSKGSFSEQGYYFPKEFHRHVAYLYPGPDAILASLPSWYGRRVIFKNSEGYHYYAISWQVGEIYELRSRFKYLMQSMGLNYSGKTEDLDYFEIVGFERE